MNTEKLEKLKKSLDNKFIPDNMKDKIRAEIKKLEADIKTDETITATEVKEEVKEIEKKVEKALEVAEEKEEQAEAKKEEAEEKKAKKSRTKTTKTDEKPKSAKKTVFSIAKEIRKENESWEDAKERARKMMKSETTETKKTTKTETQKLLAMVRRNKEYKKLTGSSDLPKDAKRRALPRGKRVSANGNVYYENRANRVDVGGFKNAYLENGGGVDGIVELKPLELIPLSTQLNRLSGYNWTYGDWESEDGGKPSTMPNSVIVNVHTKQKFRLSPITIEEKYPSNSHNHLYIKNQYRIVKYSEDGRIIEYTSGWHDTREDAVQELREMFGSYENGGKLKKMGRYSILGEVDGKQPLLYATTDDKERIKPLVNMAEIDLYELTGKNHRIFVTDEVTDDEVYHYGNGGRTRERRYVNHSEDYEVRYSKDKPHRRGYGYENGGSIEDERFKKFINSQVSYIISLKTISQKREPIQNLLDNMEDYRSGSEIVKRITTDNLKYALKQKTVSKMNEVLRISLNALQYADGGTIIGTPETPLARNLDIDYTGLVGETGGMSAGEMFAMGGSLGNHGLKQGDQIIKTMSGGVQKVKTKDGQTMYVDLSSGYRGAEPPLPFAKGGALTNERKHVNKSQDYEVRYAKNKPNRTGYKGKRSFDDGGFMTDPNFGDFQNAVYATGGGVDGVKYEIELFWIGLSGNERKIGKYVVSEKTLDELESQWSHTLSIDVIDESDKKPISWFELKKELYAKGKEKYLFATGGSIAEKSLYIPTYQVLKVHTTDGKVFENVYSDTNVITGVYVSEKPLRKKDVDDKNQLELFRKGGLPKTAIYIPRYKVDFIETEYDGDIQGNHIYGGVWIDMKKQFRLVEEAKKQGRFGDKPKFKVDDLVYNKRTKSVGIVRLEDEKGETKTDADGNVNTSELEKYNPLKNKSHKNAKVAPSTQKEIDNRGLFKPFSKYEGGGSVINLDNKYAYITYEGQPLEGGETQRIVSHKYSDSKFDKKTLTLSFKDGSNLVLEKEISDFEKGKEVVVKSGEQYVAIQLLKDKTKTTKTSKGGSTKRGGAMQLAKQIRKEGESWQSALKRANEQMRNK